MSNQNLYVYAPQGDDAVEVRMFSIDGEPWFVAADVARILEYRMASDLTRRLDDDDRGTRSVRTPSGDQVMTIISEPGFYAAILGSQSVKAKRVKHWLTHEVMPSIRKTGRYAVEETREQRIALGLQAATELLAERDVEIAELRPRAEVADRILDADGDLSVGDAAKSLTRAGIKVGEQRLFKTLGIKGWIYRSRGDGRWRVAQRAIETGYMSVIPQSHYHPKSGVLVLDPPQPRVTPKGLQRLLADNGGANQQLAMTS